MDQAVNPGAQPQPDIQLLISLIQSQNLIQQQQLDRMNRMEDDNRALRDALLQRQGKPRTKPQERPIIEADSSDNTWEVFLDSWKIYKRMANIYDGDANTIRDELRSACSREVNQLLFNFVGQTTLDSADESTLLGYIKAVSVRGVHTEVHRHHFFKMTQSEGETITHFVARLRSQALLCQFSVTGTVSCPCPTPAHCPAICPATSPVSYMDEMIASQMVSGLINTDHQNRILAEAAKLKSYKAKFDMLISLEMTDKSTPLLSNHHNSPATPSSSASSKSDYKKQQYTKHKEKDKDQSNTNSPNTNKFRGCGRSGHPDSHALHTTRNAGSASAWDIFRMYVSRPRLLNHSPTAPQRNLMRLHPASALHRSFLQTDPHRNHHFDARRKW